MNLKSFANTLIVVAVLAASALTTGCNLYDPIDNPSGDAQLLSAARACFDQGQFDCALEYYGKMSGSNADVVAAETAFVQLDKAGAGMGALMKAVGNGSSGGASALTSLAGELAVGAGSAKRLELLAAYNQIAKIQSVPLKGLVRFVSSLAIAATILGEETHGRALLQKTDLLSNATSCTTVTCGTNPAGCLPLSPAVIITGAEPATLNTASLSATSPTWGMVNKALKEVLFALQNELSASGKFSTGLGGFSTAITAVDFSSQPGCYRLALFNLGVGK